MEQNSLSVEVKLSTDFGPSQNDEIKNLLFDGTNDLIIGKDSFPPNQTRYYIEPQHLKIARSDNKVYVHNMSHEENRLGSYYMIPHGQNVVLDQNLRVLIGLTEIKIELESNIDTTYNVSSRKIFPMEDFVPLTIKKQGEKVAIGQNENNDIVIEDRCVSRHHLLIIFNKDTIELLDEKSKMHTWVYIKDKIEIASHQTLIRIGQFANIELTREKIHDMVTVINYPYESGNTGIILDPRKILYCYIKSFVPDKDDIDFIAKVYGYNQQAVEQNLPAILSLPEKGMYDVGLKYNYRKIQLRVAHYNHCKSINQCIEYIDRIRNAAQPN